MQKDVDMVFKFSVEHVGAEDFAERAAGSR